MKMLKWTLGVLLALVLAVLVGGYLLSPRFTVTRSIAIAAPVEKVYPLVAGPRQWKGWAVWNRRDPAMQIEYTGPESGTGAAWSWKSETEGNGAMTFTLAEPAQRVAYELRFADFGTTSTGELRLAPRGSGTEVTWVMHGDMGSHPLFRWMALFADGMVGPDFEAGLQGLKALAEKP